MIARASRTRPDLSKLLVELATGRPRWPGGVDLEKTVVDPPRQDVEVKVRHLLPSGPTIGLPEAEALRLEGAPQGARHLHHRGHHGATRRRVQLEDGLDVGLRNDEAVTPARLPWIDQGHSEIVIGDDSCRHLTGDYPAEQAVRLHRVMMRHRRSPLHCVSGMVGQG